MPTDKQKSQGNRARLPGVVPSALPWLLVLMMASISPAHAEMTHRACISLSEREPERALTEAERWSTEGGDPAAAQCAAAALFALGRYQDAARRLEALAERSFSPSLRAAVLAQATRSWLAADATDAATEAIERAITLAPDDPQLLIDRAEIHAQSGDYGSAVGDLTAALAKDPRSADALVFRASAQRRLGNIDAALADLTDALAIDRNHAEGLLERGLIRQMKGDLDGARADWQAAVAAAPGTPAAEMAIAYLAHATP